MSARILNCFVANSASANLPKLLPFGAFLKNALCPADWAACRAQKLDRDKPTPGSEPVTIATNLLGSSECSDALQVLCCALGGRAFGSLSHRVQITAHG
jgi:hypothetical protein